MKKLFLAVGIMFLFSNRSNSEQPQSGYDRSWLKPQLEIYKNIRYAVQADSFQNDTSSDRKLDLYRPSGNLTVTYPVVLFIHGGGFSGGDKKQMETFCSRLAEKGYAVVSINYRLELRRKKIEGAGAGSNMAKGLPENKKFHPGLNEAILLASQDAQLALEWIKNNAKKYQLNTPKLAIAGGSAGSITALYTAYISRERILPIKAVINFWGGLENADLIPQNAAPVLSYHGDKDDIINIAYAYAIHDKMKSEGNSQSELHILEGKGHARYDIITNEKIDEIDSFLKKAFATN